MTTKVKLLHLPPQPISRAKVGDEGYIDGYVRGADNVPYAVVVFGEQLEICPIFNLKVLR